jgi:dihydrofolate reductase
MDTILIANLINAPGTIADRLIGFDGHLAYRFPEDLQHFMKLTVGNACVMGRETFESLPTRKSDGGKALSNRLNIILTRDNDYQAPEPAVLVAHSLHGAMQAVAKNADYLSKDIYICGGQSVYEQAMLFADRLVITYVDAKISLDGAKDLRYFPEIDLNIWHEMPGTIYGVTKDGFNYRICEYRRKSTLRV